MRPAYGRLAAAFLDSTSLLPWAEPPGWDGSLGRGLVGVHGVPRGRTWPPVVFAETPDVPGDEVHLVALADGTLVVDEEVPDGCLEPIAFAVEERFPPPYRALARRQAGDLWAVAAEQVAIVDFADDDSAASIEVTCVDGTVTCIVDEAMSSRRFPELEQIGLQNGSGYTLRAERLEPDTWVVDASPL
jgi:hypothetical protein